MNASRQPRRTWIVAAIPLLAMILIGILLVAVRSASNQVAPSTAQAQPVSRPASESATAAPASNTPAQPAPATGETAVGEMAAEEIAEEIAAEEIVAIVGDVTITLNDLNEAAVIDAVMAGLAGQPPTNAARIVEQLINTEVVLGQTGVMAADQETVAALEGFLAAHSRNYGDLAAALATNGIAQGRFDHYFARLVSADAYLRSQQAATGGDTAVLLRGWQQEARISFGPIANSILAAQAPPVALPDAVTAVPAMAAFAEPAIDPADELAAAPPAIDANEPRGTEVGQVAPDFTLPKLSSDFSTKSLRNLLDSPSVLIFWTTWCPYCLRQTPALVEAHRQWDEQGIQFVGINVKEDPGVVEPYVQQHEIEYPVLLDADGATAAAYAVQGYPTTYFLDGNNRIVARHVGALTEEQLNNYLLTLQPAD